MSGESSTAPSPSGIKAIDGTSVHRITSGQVVIDLQTAVKELVENSLDAGATSIEVRFKEYGLQAIEVIDNGSGIPKDDYPKIALKHHTSKLATFEDLTSVRSFGFRGEALSSLCALSESVTFITAMAEDAPMGTILEFDRSGKLKSSSGKVARQRGTTATVTGIFTPLPVRRKELERNIKREFAKVLNLLNAYALVPCSEGERGVRLAVYNQPDKGRRSIQLRTDGTKSLRAGVSSLWGPKTLENLVPLELVMEVEADKHLLKRSGLQEHTTEVHVTGLISRFSIGCGRTGTDRQFLYVNGRPWNAPKVQKAFNEVYRTFNVNQSPFIIADFRIPTSSYDINVSPDKRTILIHSEPNLIAELRDKLESVFSDSRSTFAVNNNPTAKPAPSGKPTPNNTPAVSSGESSPSSALQKKPSNRVTEASKGGSEDEVSAAVERQDGSDVPTASNTGESESFAHDTSLEMASGNDSSSGHPLFLPDSPPPQIDSLPPSGNKDTQSSTSTTSSNTQRFSPEEPQGNYESIRHVVSPVGTKITKYTTPAVVQKPVQMVISTSGASWNLGQSGTTSKKRRLEKDNTLSENDPKQKKLSFQKRLTEFARGGSQAQSTEDEMDVDESDSCEDEDMMDEGQSRHKTRPEATARRSAAVEDEDELEDPEVQFELENDPDAEMDEVVPQTVEDRSTQIKQQPTSRNRGRHSSSSTVHSPSISKVGTGTPSAPKRPSSAMSVDVIDLTMEDNQNSQRSRTCNKATSQRSIGEGGSQENNQQSSHGTSQDSEVVRSVAPSDDVTITCDMESISSYWKKYRKSMSVTPIDNISGDQDSTFPLGFSQHASATNPNDDGSAERELSRVIHKEDFNSMEIIGQFNLGFIVARRRISKVKVSDRSDSQASTEWDDLFLIDQHAADEKYNFETLQQTTRIQSQRLLQ
ncbi:hypothetical protein FRC03_000214 [Tulasnella sp. 419]|nr:hypothetical protein FRC03_000214 [Tulasnella sp. 419]